VIYDFEKNIDKNGTDLKYKKAEDRKLLVEVEGKNATGKTISVQKGSTGGEKFSLKISGVSNTSSLEKLAEQALTEKVYTGYEGQITGWLIPYCDAGYSATIRDADYEYKNGTYYVLGVKVEMDGSGGDRRIVKLGKKLRD
jgi:hypothetical protein